MRNLLATFQRLPRDTRLYIWAWGLAAFGYFGIWGVLFNLYLLRLGYGPEMIGLLVGGGQLVWGLSAIPASMIGGRIGNRKGMILGMTLAGITIALLLLAQGISAPFQAVWITIWWISSWIGTSLMLVNSTPYIMEVAPLEERRNVFAIQQACMGLLGFVGSLAAGFLPNLFAGLADAAVDSSTAYWYVLWLTPLSYLCATWLLKRTEIRPPVVREVQGSQDAVMPIFIIAFVGVIVFLQTAGEGTIRAFFNVYLDTSLQTPTSRIGLVMGLGQFLPIISSLAAPQVMAYWGVGRTIVVMAALSSLFMLVLAYFANWGAASAGYVGVLFTISISSVARNIFSQELVAPRWRTIMSAAFTIGLALGWASAAGLGGYLITASGYRTLFFVGAMMALCSGMLLWGYLHVQTRVKASAPVNPA